MSLHIKQKVDNFLKTDNEQVAIATIKRELKNNPTDSELLGLLGYVYSYINEHELAYEYYHQAREYAADNAEYAAGVLIEATFINAHEGMEELFQIIKDEESGICILAKSLYYLEINNIRMALECIKEGYIKYPENLDIAIQYLKTLIVNNSGKEQVEAAFNQLSKVDDDRVKELRIKYLYREARFEDCEKECRRITRLYPNEKISEYANTMLSKLRGMRFNDVRNKENAQQTKTAGTQQIADEGDAIFAELDRLIGLDSVKAEVRRIRKRLEFDKIRKETLKFSGEGDVNYHFVFSGNPGTGKTTVARLLADIFKDIGVLEKGQLVEVDRSGLVAEYVGQTAVKTREAVKSALGGVLFIDEAYALCSGEDDDFGKEAVDTLVKCMEDYRNDLIVILAGYKDEMHKFIKANVGLESRFTTFIEFPDYSEDELLEIAKLLGGEQHYEFSKEGELAFIERINRLKVDKKFGNARAVRNLMNEAFSEKAVNYDPCKHTKKYLTTLTAEDFGVNINKNVAEDAQTYIDELNAMTGLDAVKQEVLSTISIMDYMKKEKELTGENTALDMNMHMSFLGNPGTGKTTVARLYGKILKSMGILKKGQMVEVSRNDLVAGYVGQTAIKTKAKCEEAYGGILFIDEAYSLCTGPSDSFGMEAVSTLIKEMEDNRDILLVIFAGYSKEMEGFMNSNSGIKSRIAKNIEFPDYNAEELLEIFKETLERKDITITDEAMAVVQDKIGHMYENRDARFGNARDVRNLYEKVWKNMVARVVANNLEGEDRKRIIADDIKDLLL